MSTWSYGDRQTSLNGMLNWLYANFDFDSHRIELPCKIILDWWLSRGKRSPKGSIIRKANAVSYQVHDHRLFDEFRTWCLTTYSKEITLK